MFNSQLNSNLVKQVKHFYRDAGSGGARGTWSTTIATGIDNMVLNENTFVLIHASGYGNNDNYFYSTETVSVSGQNVIVTCSTNAASNMSFWITVDVYVLV